MSHQRSLAVVRFPALLDWWVAALVCVLLASMLASIPLVIAKTESVAASAVLTALLVGFFLFIIDKAFFLSYMITPHGLLLSSQFQKVLIPYRNMKKIKNGSVLDLFSRGGQKRFALSANCLVLHLEDFEWKRISISPGNKQEFISLLLGNLEAERGNRATYIEDGTRMGKA